MPGSFIALLDKVSTNVCNGLKPLYILRNWLFQGLLYVDRTERYFKIGCDLALTAALFLALGSPDIAARLALAFLISHTFFWIFNGQQLVLAKKFNLVRNDPQRIIDYAYGFRKRAAGEKSIGAVLVYGSLSRESIKPTSDLDVRVVRNPGLINGLRACLFGFKERSRALFVLFPLDLYIVDSEKHLLKMRADEVPIILYNHKRLPGPEEGH